MSAQPPKKARPPLPDGPYGAVDSRHPEEAAGLWEVGVEVFLDADGLALLEGVRTVVMSPGAPREAAAIAVALPRTACASFENFERRGEHFRELVEALR